MPTDLLRALLGSLQDELPRTTAGFVANHHPRFLPPAEAVGAVARSRAHAFIAAATTPPEPGPGA